MTLPAKSVTIIEEFVKRTFLIFEVGKKLLTFIELEKECNAKEKQLICDCNVSGNFQVIFVQDSMCHFYRPLFLTILDFIYNLVCSMLMSSSSGNFLIYYGDCQKLNCLNIFFPNSPLSSNTTY